MKPRERFAVNLRKARQKKGISQEELGFRCELHRTEISLLERGGREPRLGTIVKLAGALDTTPERALRRQSRWLARQAAKPSRSRSRRRLQGRNSSSRPRAGAEEALERCRAASGRC